MDNSPNTFCEYINHPTFMQIEDDGDIFIITMKSMVSYTGIEKPVFETLKGSII